MSVLRVLNVVGSKVRRDIMRDKCPRFGCFNNIVDAEDMCRKCQMEAIAVDPLFSGQPKEDLTLPRHKNREKKS